MSADRLLLYRDGDDLPNLLEKANNIPGSIIINPAEGFEGEFRIVALHQFQILPTSVGWILVMLVEVVRNNALYEGISVQFDEDSLPPAAIHRWIHRECRLHSLPPAARPQHGPGR